MLIYLIIREGCYKSLTFPNTLTLSTSFKNSLFTFRGFKLTLHQILFKSVQRFRRSNVTDRKTLHLTGLFNSVSMTVIRVVIVLPRTYSMSSYAWNSLNQ